MSPKERTAVRAIVKALRTRDVTDLRAISVSYSVVQRLDNAAGLRRQSADLLEALIDAKES